MSPGASPRIAHELGIVIHGTFILGPCPAKPRETIQETLNFAKEINPAHDPGVTRGALSGHLLV